MSAQNIIVKGADNPVIIKFNFSGEFAAEGLNNFSRITVKIGDETYDSSVGNVVLITSKTELRVIIGTETNLRAGSYPLKITGFNQTYDDGFEITSRKNKRLDDVRVIG